MKEIKEYLEVAIDNGFKIPKDFEIVKNTFNKEWIYIKIYDKAWQTERFYSLQELITSKEFIEAIARGIIEKVIKIECPFIIWGWNMESSCNLSEIEELTIMQAIAIRDNKLEEFINNILPNGM